MHARGFVRAIRHTMTLKRALRRLESARLVQTIGWIPREVASGADRITREVYVRNVFGSRLLRLSPDAPSECLVPVSTKVWMTMAATHGGKRRSAGRKGRDLAASTPSNSNQVYPRVAAPESIKCTPRVKYSTKRVISGCGFPLPSEAGNRAAGAAPILKIGFESESEIGLTLGDGSNTPPNLNHPAVPPFPGNTIVAPVTVPEAIHLDDGASKVMQVNAMMKAYRGAIERRYGGRCFAFSKGDVSRSKHFKGLSDFADALIAHKISPSAWCIHRVDKWREQRGHIGKAKPGERRAQPSIQFVFAARSIEDDSRWRFRQEYATGRLGGGQVFTATHRKLLLRWHSVQRDIRRGVQPELALLEHLPGDTYQCLVDQARLESAEMRYKLESDIQRGRHVW